MKTGTLLKSEPVVDGVRHPSGAMPVNATKAPPTRGYEELEGAQGREILFRPQRYRASDLAPLRGTIRLTIGEIAYECELFDLSQSGIAFGLPAGLTVLPGAILGPAVVSFDGYEAYCGDLRVGSLRNVDGIAITGASFIDSLAMNIEDVLLLRDVLAWKAEAGDLGVATAPWRMAGIDDFRGTVSEFRLFLEDAAAELARLEGALPWHLCHGEGPWTYERSADGSVRSTDDSLARAGLIERVEREFVPAFLGYTIRADAAIRQASKEEWQAHKEFTLRHVDALLMKAPLMYRCRAKPLGYPGDFECMNDMYFRPFQGETLFGKAVHMAACASAPARAVRSRKDKIKGQLAKLANGWNHARPLRIVSVAAGPAQEVYEYLREATHLPARMEIVLFDQDVHALSFAQRRLVPLVQARWSTQVRLVFLHDSIKRLLHDPSLFMALGPFDFVFCTGLFDYLRFITAVALCRNLHVNMAPGSEAWLGNMHPSNPGRWIFEHHLDWMLLYRTREEMLEFGHAAALPDTTLRIEEEASGINPFLVIRKE